MPLPRSIPRSYLLAIFVAALVNISPFLLTHVGADIAIYNAWIHCFSGQFWQGDLYPRWCVQANGGQGMAVFLFYFPLPFYIAALLSPLAHLGLGYYGLFALLCFLACLCAGLACYAWLKDIVTPGYALLASILYLFMPYHLEMLFFRSAYAETWCYALLPLLFKYLRRLVRGEAQSFLPLVMLIAASMLTHIPLAAEALLLGGIYVLVMTGRAWRPKLQFGFAVLWAACLDAFYVAPGIYYSQFVTHEKLAQRLNGWANGFLLLDIFRLPGMERPLFAAVLGMLLLVAVGLLVVARHRRIADAFVRRETLAWLGLSLLALFLLLPASAPVYALMGPLAKVFFPWRMQMMSMLGITYMLAVWMQWLASPGRRKTWKTDYGIAIVILWAVSNVMVASFSDKNNALNDRVVAASINASSEYRTQWTEPKYWDYQYLLEQEEKHLPKAAIVSGKGEVTVEAWQWRGIRLQVKAASPVQLRLAQYYFPVWSATMDDGKPLPIAPETGSGHMLLEVPPGNHRITLSYHVARGVPLLVACQWLSLLAWLLLGAAFARRRFARRSTGG